LLLVGNCIRSCGAAAEEGQIQVRSGEQVANLLKLETGQQEIPAIVFLPGLFGSVLKSADGAILWGENITEPTNLAYNKAEVIQTSILLNFGNFEVYRPFIERLDSLSLTDKYLHFEFSYDWRADIRATAKTFSEWLNKNVVPHTKHRKLIFVAHSMGGEVLKWWYKYEKDSVPDLPPVSKVIFVGTPHRGSPIAIRIAMDGWTPDIDGFLGFIEKFMPKLKSLNMALPTFPSVYQLLPAKSTKSVSRNTSWGTKETIDPYEFKVWKKFNWVQQLVNRTGTSENNVREQLSNAAQFRADLEGFEIPHAIYFFGQTDEPDTTAGYSCDDVSSSCKIIRGSGDRTVPQEIAKNHNPQAGPDDFRLIQAEHMQLLIHPAVLDYLKDLLGASDQESASTTIKILNRDPKLLKMAQTTGLLINTFSWPRTIAMEMAINYNKSVLAVSGVAAKLAFPTKGYSPSANLAFDASFLEAALTDDSLGKYNAAMSQLVKQLIEKRSNWYAIDICHTVLGSDRFQFEGSKHKAELLKNCGIAYSQAGYSSIAMQFWTQANSEDQNIEAQKFPINLNDAVYDSIHWNPFQSAVWVKSGKSTKKN
jgi:pimeloyl-ACP methyl ester carboxylesterase